ncbi:GNAT family N-acetyltransferase [Paucibacter aquatile]|uniref:GNAT family N-acetyltransferase n=1 Tax=Kinneretia aquatilis TaxID=2070761 RepID=A0A2N8L0J2_9BURK|nr:GNAT family N-acetyltransferase [Paucibacter aquatile]PND39228.1 GNAT family N-acetyltransferase [Paucibacter aquatile]
MSSILFSCGAGRYCRELTAADVPAVQRFLEANPEYFWTVGDEPPRPDEAQQEFDERPPAELSYSRLRQLGFYAEPSGELLAYGSVVEDLMRPGVCHLALFIVATARHGRGDAAPLYQGLEQWARAQGARWMRLGVVLGNTRAERFWQGQGFVELRRREGVPAGRRLNTLRVMLKPLLAAGAAGKAEADEIADYLCQVARDRPEP